MITELQHKKKLTQKDREKYTKDPINNKICSCCKTELHKSNFTSHKLTPDGLYHTCYTCHYKLNKKTTSYKNQYNDKKKNWEINKQQTDINYKLSGNLRCRLNSSLRSQYTQKNNSFIKYLGCSIEEYKLFLEKQFETDMNWDNHGVLWEIDHIYPLSKFDLTKEENIFKAFNYKNTQPLYKSENKSKSNKI